MCALFSLAAAHASRSKRAIVSAEGTAVDAMSLTATLRLSRRSLATQSDPIPPRASSRSIWYLPARSEPEARASLRSVGPDSLIGAMLSRRPVAATEGRLHPCVGQPCRRARVPLDPGAVGESGPTQL